MGLYLTALKVRALYSVLVPVFMTALITGIVGVALTVPLPRGIGVFRSFSQIFY
jgi:hypothetical protein